MSATDKIAQFSTITKQWKIIGKLNTARFGHGTFLQMGELVVVGGALSKFGTERCSLVGESIECIDVNPELDEYATFPHMMRVPDNYCVLS